MVSIIIKGILLGLSIGFFFGFGPAFFAIIQTSIYRGPLRGALLASGVFLSDLLMVILTIIGASSIFEKAESSHMLGFTGGAVLVAYGIFIFNKKSMRTKSEEKKELDIKNPHAIIYPFKGFILNIANPAIWLFWASVVMGVSAPFKANIIDLFIFFSAVLLTVFSSDLLKVFVSHKLTKIINDRFLMAINKIAGLGLSVFGIFLIVKTIITMG